jgi:hypothetical protein
MLQQPSKSVAQRVHGYGQMLPLTTVDSKEAFVIASQFLRLKTNYGTIPANNPVLAVSAASTRLNGVAACGAGRNEMALMFPLKSALNLQSR